MCISYSYICCFPYTYIINYVVYPYLTRDNWKIFLMRMREIRAASPASDQSCILSTSTRHVNISFALQNWSRMAVRTEFVRSGAVKHGKRSDDSPSFELWGASHPGSWAHSRDDPLTTSIVLRPLRQRRPAGRESQFLLRAEELWKWYVSILS